MLILTSVAISIANCANIYAAFAHMRIADVTIYAVRHSSLQWRIQGGIQGVMDPPFLPSSLVEVYVLWETLVLMDPPYLMNSKIILTVAYLQEFLNEFWSISCPRAQQTTQNTPFSRVGYSNRHCVHSCDRGQDIWPSNIGLDCLTTPNFPSWPFDRSPSAHAQWLKLAVWPKITLLQ